VGHGPDVLRQVSLRKYDSSVILWINGAFGVGKTTTAQAIRERAPAWRLFDPENVGLLLATSLSGIDFNDFQDLSPWRSLVPLIASELSEFTGEDLLIVQTVLVQDYWEEMQASFAERGQRVVHILLDAPAMVLEARIRADQIERSAEKWRLDHVETYESAKTWLLLTADLVVDSNCLSPGEVASSILQAVK
jgi:adenylylsulfate kinase-like enzyme